jgi:HPt (histidine-containing phosphotransfer) domain-containing protein
MRLDEADAAGARLKTHTLKGSSATVAAERLNAVATAMERAVIEGNLGRCAELLPRATGEFERFRSTLERLGADSGRDFGRIGADFERTNHD